MKKNKFIKSTLILIIGGAITKALGMIIRITMTRLMGTQGIGLYMMILPTFTLFIALAQAGIPIAISKLVAEDKNNNKNLIFSIIPVSMIINIIIIIFILFASKFISINLLNEPKTYLGLRAIAFVLPFISISSILRSYFFGKQKMIPHVVSNIIEDIVRLIILICAIPMYMKLGIEHTINIVILSNIISEFTSIIVLLFFLPKNFHIQKKDIKPDYTNIKTILNLSIPTTSSRLISSLGYFLEPVILTHVLLNKGYTSSFIVNEYGILNGYVMPILLLPSFFTSAISQALLPIVSKSYSNRLKIYTTKKIKEAIIVSLLIGIPATLLFMFVPNIPLKLIYNTTKGINYIRFLAPICLLQYIQAPLSSSLQAMGKTKDILKGTILSIIIRSFSIYFFSSLGIGIYGLIIATSINIIFVTFYDIKHVKKYLH